jgi:hypothetical protein
VRAASIISALGRVVTSIVNADEGVDTTSPGNAVRRLSKGLARYQREAADEQIRDGLIQRFEFTS